MTLTNVSFFFNFWVFYHKYEELESASMIIRAEMDSSYGAFLSLCYFLIIFLQQLQFLQYLNATNRINITYKFMHLQHRALLTIL